MQGMATVRVYDRSGTMTEQPVIAAGIPYAPNPYGYGAVNPYGRNPYTGTASGIGLAPGIGVSPSRGHAPRTRRNAVVTAAACESALSGV